MVIKTIAGRKQQKVPIILFYAFPVFINFKVPKVFLEGCKDTYNIKHDTNLKIRHSRKGGCKQN